MNPLSCSQCGAVNASDARVCYQCKKILSIGAHSICNSCYHRNPLHLTNCVNCGLDLAETKEVTMESAVAVETGQSEGTGPLSPTNENFNSLLEESKSNASFYEAKTRKHEIPSFQTDELRQGDGIDTAPLREGISSNQLEPTHSQEDIMDSTNKFSENSEEEVTSNVPREGTASSSDEVDILSMLDLNLEENKFTPEPPRQISQDQIKPTDWINELVPSTDELPTMADMLPEPTQQNPDFENESLQMPSSVMDLLFGETGSLEAEKPAELDAEPPTVPSMPTEPLIENEVPPTENLVPDTPQIVEPTAPVEDQLDDQNDWLNDAMGDLEEEAEPLFEASDDVQEDLPEWMDFGPPAAELPDPSAANGFIENQVAAIEDEEDALNWLTDEAEVAEASEEEAPQLPNTAQLGQTKDLSSSPFAEIAETLENDTELSDEGGAVQANLPNWIKQMAPDSEKEAVGLANAEPENSPMDDDALSAILDSMDIESEEVVEEPIEVSGSILDEELESAEPDFETPAAAIEVPVIETDTDIQEPDFDFADDVGPTEEELIQNAISAIESEIEEIRATEESDNGLEQITTSEALPSTKDLPDWLQDPQTSPLDAEKLGFIEAKIEEAKELSADQLGVNPAEEIQNIIAEHASPAATEDNLAKISSDMPVDTAAELAQFDWGDVENVFDEPDTAIESEPAPAVEEPLEEAPIANELPSFDSPLTFEPEPEVESNSDSIIEEPASAFNWLQDSNEMDFGSAEISEPESDFADLNLEPLDTLSIGVPHDTIIDEIEEDAPAEESVLGSILQETPAATMDILEEPQIEAPSLDEISETFDPPTFDPPSFEMPSLDEPAAEESFEPLVEFDDETDIFSAVRDQPPVERAISAESIADFDDVPVEMPQGDLADTFSLDAENQSADDFFSALAEERKTNDMPSWAQEMAPQEVEVPEDTSEGDSLLSGIDDVVDIAPSIPNQVSEISNLHTPQMMEPIAHRKRARLAAQAAGTVPMTDPTQPVVVPKERQKYQPRFNATQFDGRPNVNKKKRSRQIGALVIAGVLGLAVAIAFLVPIILDLFR